MRIAEIVEEFSPYSAIGAYRTVFRERIPEKVPSGQGLLSGPFVNILECYSDESLRRRMERNAVEHAETYAWSNIAEKYLELFRRLQDVQECESRS